MLVPDVRVLLSKLPHYLNVLFGGKQTIEEEHTYDKDGKIIDTQYRFLSIINRQDLNPLVKKSQVLKDETKTPLSIEVR
jgi:hypothetical protein